MMNIARKVQIMTVMVLFMDNNKKMLLEQKKARLKAELQRAEIQQFKDNFTENIEDFSQKYRYADEAEANKIEKFISKLNFVQPGQLGIEEICPYTHKTVYLCFLMGAEALFQLYIFGKYDDIMSDCDEWTVFSPYLLLVNEDFIHYVYLNDYGEILESKIT